MSSIIDSIFTEWRASLPQGSEYPKFTNAYHMVLLKEVCRKHGIDNDVINNVILMLEKEEKPLDDKEREKAKKLGLVSKGFGNWGKDKDGPTTHKTKDGKLVPIGDDESDVKEPEVNPLFQKDGEPDDELIKTGSSKEKKIDKDVEKKDKKQEYSFRSKADATEGLFTTADDGYKTITTKDGKGFKVRQLKHPETGAPLDTIDPKQREVAISVVRGKLDELKEKSQAAIDLLKTEKDKVERTLALKWLGEYGEMQSYVDLLERGDVSDVYLLTDSEPKNDLVIVMEDEKRNIDAYGVSVKTTEGGTMANKRGSSVKGDFMDRIGASKNSNMMIDGVTAPVDAGVMVNSLLELRKKFIKMKSEGKTGVNENGDTVVNYKGEKIIIAEFFRKQEIEKQDVLDLFNDDKMFPNNKRNPIRGLQDEVLEENQMNQLKQHFQNKILDSFGENENITIEQLQDFMIDDFADTLEKINVDLVPSADLMVSYYGPDGFLENGFMSKESQKQKMEEQLGPISNMNKKDQITKILGLDFTGRGAGKKKEGVGHVDGQSFGRPNAKIQPEPSKVDDYIKEISSK